MAKLHALGNEKKTSFSFAFLSFFRNFIIFDDDFRAKKHATQDRNLSDGKKRNEFLCFALDFLVTLPSEMANLLRLGIKKIEIFCSALDFLVTLHHC